MKINIIGRQLNVYDDTKALIEEKLSKLDKFFGGEANATVTLSHKRNLCTLEVTIKASNTLFRSEVDADSFRDALDRSIENIERQIRKNKTRIEKVVRRGAFSTFDEDDDDEYEEESEFEIRLKTFPFKPMTPEEAILQMNLLGHEFFAFNDAESGDTCVVYKRKAGGYGLIMQEK